MNVSTLLSAIPSGLRDPLISEYNSIVQNFLEHRWTPTELSGGKFCEIVYTILDGRAKSAYLPAPTKPSNFVDSCRRLENNSGEPRSFQILIPRLLPALYEIRNNRNVGHVGGDVDPNQMDSIAVTQISGWVMGELVRVYHNVSTREAQKAVNFLTERKIPLVWQTLDGVKRILNPKLPIPDQLIILMGTSSGKLNTEELTKWLDYSNQAYIKRLFKKLHSERKIEYNETDGTVELLPPGVQKLEGLIEKNR
jgi:hypothetical protein